MDVVAVCCTFCTFAAFGDVLLLAVPYRAVPDLGKDLASVIKGQLARARFGKYLLDDVVDGQLRHLPLTRLRVVLRSRENVPLAVV